MVHGELGVVLGAALEALMQLLAREVHLGPPIVPHDVNVVVLVHPSTAPDARGMARVEPEAATTEGASDAGQCRWKE